MIILDVWGMFGEETCGDGSDLMMIIEKVKRKRW